MKPDPKDSHDSIVKHLVHYTPSVLFRNIAGILNTIIRPKLLTPQWFGLWSLLNVIPSYARYLHLGCRDYMRFAVPRLLAQGEEARVQRIEISVFWGSLIPNTGVAAALFILAAFGRFERDLRTGLAAIAVLTVLTCIYEFYATFMKGRKMFRTLSRGMYLRNTIQLLLSIGLMLKFGIYGLFIALPLSLLIGLLYFCPRCSFNPFGPGSWGAYLEMVKDGWPLTAFTFFMTLMITAGRLVVAGALSAEEVGYYALATLALRGMLEFPGAAREVVEPRIMEELSTQHDETILDRYLYRPMAINACYLPMIIGPLSLVLPPLIRWLLPRYIPGILPLQIILFGFYFLSLFYPMRGILVALHMQKAAAMLAGGSVLLNIVLSLIALRARAGIVGVAAANTISYALLLVMMGALLRLKGQVAFPFAKVWPAWAAFPLLCAAIGVSHLVVEPLTGSGFLGAAIQSALLVAAGLTFVTLTERKAALLKDISPLSVLKIFFGKKR